MRFLLGILAVIGVFAVFLFGAALLFAFPVMWLWNYVCPELFALPLIGFWQAFALLLLCGLLFKSSSSNKSKE